MQDPSTWRLVTATGNIPVKHVSRSGSFGSEDSTATDEIIIRASDLAAFARLAFPLTTTLFGTVFYPRRLSLPGFPALIVKSLDWKEFNDDIPVDPFGGDPGAPEGTYNQFVTVTIQYGTNPGNDEEPDSDNPFTFLEVSSESGGEFLSSTVDGENATWDTAIGDLVIDVDIPKTVIETTTLWTIRWPQIPWQFFNDTVVTRMRGLRGLVNSSPMAMLNNAPAETILFLSFGMSENFTWQEGQAGKSPITVGMKFLEKNFLHKGAEDVQVTHNHFYDKETHKYRELFINGKEMFGTGDLESIWKPS